MSNLPSVNIMIPTYNQASLIGKAISSAVLQDYPNLRVIVADDCSTDATEEVVNAVVRQQGDRILYMKNATNLGRVANYRNCLYNYADAEWVVNLDGDDYYTDPHFVSHAMNRILDAGIDKTLFYQGAHIWKKGGETNTFTFQMPEDETVLPARDYFSRFFKLSFFSHMSTLYNRQAATASGFYELDVISSDMYSILQLCLKNPQKQVVLSKKVSGYWVHGEENASQSKDFQKNLKNMQIYTRLFRIMQENGWPLSDAAGWTATSLYRYMYAYLFC